MLKHRKAQSTAEYVIVLGLIVAAVIAMQTYVKRGFQGRIRDAVDYVDNGDGSAVTFTKKQYEPYYLESKFTSDRTSAETEQLKEAGAVRRDIEGEDVSTRYGEQKILEPKDE